MFLSYLMALLNSGCIQEAFPDLNLFDVFVFDANQITWSLYRIERLVAILALIWMYCIDLDLSSVSFVTGNANPPHNITSWFQSRGQGRTRDDTANQIPHDIYVIGTQEDPLGEKEWIDLVKGALRDITNISFKQVSFKHWCQEHRVVYRVTRHISLVH